MSQDNIFMSGPVEIMLVIGNDANIDKSKGLHVAQNRVANASFCEAIL